MEKDPINCPFCEAETNGFSRGWGFGPEGWSQIKKIHDENHCDKCPTCRQSIITNVIKETYGIRY